jgi:hypothetical protein
MSDLRLHVGGPICAASCRPTSGVMPLPARVSHRVRQPFEALRPRTTLWKQGVTHGV